MSATDERPEILTVPNPVKAPGDALPTPRLPARLPLRHFVASRSARAFSLSQFAAVGVVALVVDLGLFNLLRFGPGELLDDRPITAKVIATVVATLVSWMGNRHWTFSEGALNAAVVSSGSSRPSTWSAQVRQSSRSRSRTTCWDSTPRSPTTSRRSSASESGRSCATSGTRSWSSPAPTPESLRAALSLKDPCVCPRPLPQGTSAWTTRPSPTAVSTPSDEGTNDRLTPGQHE